MLSVENSKRNMLFLFPKRFQTCFLTSNKRKCPGGVSNNSNYDYMLRPQENKQVCVFFVVFFFISNYFLLQLIGYF